LVLRERSYSQPESPLRGKAAKEFRRKQREQEREERKRARKLEKERKKERKEEKKQTKKQRANSKSKRDLEWAFFQDYFTSDSA